MEERLETIHGVERADPISLPPLGLVGLSMMSMMLRDNAIEDDFSSARY